MAEHATPDRDWPASTQASGFGPEALPYAVVEPGDGAGPRVAARLGDQALDLPSLLADEAPHLSRLTDADRLDPLMAAGPATWRELRERLVELVAAADRHPVLRAAALPLASVREQAPFTVADYVDFFSSRQHAENASRIFRPGQPTLRPNWLHLPVAYHGRAGTVVPSGTGVRRPWGQRRPEQEATGPVFAPTAQLDLEAEVGFVVGAGSPLGEPVALEDFDEHVFGVVLVNDWSARDVQAWEALPLGPFLGKSFATSVSSWVLPLAALDDARVPLPAREQEPVAYLAGPGAFGLDLLLEVRVNGTVVSRPPFRELYYSPAQQLAHLTVNGASLRTGDLLASGTVSGDADDQVGSLLELSWGGTRPFGLEDGSTRTWLEDGDEVVITASAPTATGPRINLGEVRGTVLAARSR